MMKTMNLYSVKDFIYWVGCHASVSRFNTTEEKNDVSPMSYPCKIVYEIRGVAPCVYVEYHFEEL